MAGRNEEKVKVAIERLKKEGLEPGNGDVARLGLELEDPRKAKSAAARVITSARAVAHTDCAPCAERVDPSQEATNGRAYIPTHIGARLGPFRG